MTAFAPYNNPQVAVAIILENGGAGPAVGTIMRQILDHIMPVSYTHLDNTSIGYIL